MSDAEKHPSTTPPDTPAQPSPSSTALPSTASDRYEVTVFRDLFGSQARRDYALSLYNAINNSSYTNLDELVVTTIDNMLCIGTKNDVCFLINDEMMLWEHRFFRILESRHRIPADYGSGYLQAIESQSSYSWPTYPMMSIPPRYVALHLATNNYHNGNGVHRPRLFVQDKGEAKTSAAILEVGANHNLGLMETCDAFREYVALLESIRSHAKSESLVSAVSNAVDECIPNGILADYFAERRTELCRQLVFEHSLARTLSRIDNYKTYEFYLDGFIKGFRIGYREGDRQILLSIASLIVAGKQTVQNALDLGFTQQEIVDALARVG